MAIATAIKGRKGGSSSSRTPTEQPDDLQSVAKAKILLALGEGEFAGGLTARDIYLDGTALENSDGSQNFSGVAWEFRSGTQAQKYIQGIPGTENEINVGTEVSSSTAWTRTFTNTQLSAVRLRLKWASLFKQEDDGDLVGYSVNYAIDLQTDGGTWQTVLNTSVTGKTTSGYERSHRIDLPQAGSTWTIRLRKITADANSAKIGDTMTLQSFTEVIDAKLRYPNTALLYIEFDSSQFNGSIPQISCEPRGRVIRVPDNYDPETRTYSGTWTGAFKWAWTDNPAWIFYDLVVTDRFGLGNRLTAANIDKWTLYQVAQYCDQPVPDGKGGKYARIDTGAIIDQRPVSVIPPGNQSPPANIAISSFSVVQQNISVETMRVSWDQAQNAIAYEAQWRRNDGNWVNVPRSSTASFDVSGIYAGRYLVRVRAINAAEISSGWGYSEEKTLTGKVGNPPKPVGFMATGINWGIRLNWGFPGNTGDTLKTELQYTANSDFSDPLLLSDVPYPSAEYTQLGLKAGQEFWYRAQLVDRTGNESGYTDWIRGMSNDNADDYLGEIADDFLTSADGDRLTSDIDTNLEAAMQNALANHGTVEHQWAQYGEVRADILVVKTTIAEVDRAMAEMSTQVQAQIDNVTASLEDKLTAVVDASGASAIYTLKTGVRINGVIYNAGMSIAVLAEAGKPVVTRVGFNANQFVLMSGSGDITPQSTPFCLYRRVVVNSVASGAYHGASATIALDVSYPAMVFCKTSDTAQPTVVTAARSGGNILVGSSNAYGQAHTLTAYIFAIFPQTLPKWGFAIWDASGKLVLTNESRILSDLVTVGTPGAATGGINIDVTLPGSYAVAPAILGSQIIQNNNTKPPTIVNITAYSGCRFNGSSSRINAAPSTTATGSAAGGTTTGIALTAINTAAFD